MTDVSVVIPCYNEAASLEELHRELRAALAARAGGYELIFVDDGSTDGSGAVIRDLCERAPRVGLVELRRNFGKAAALDAGFRHATGRYVVTIDADLQDRPDEIPRLLERLDEGADVVSGWKQDRKDPVGKTLASRLFNQVVRRASRLDLHDFNCGLKAYRREAVEGLHLYGEMHRFIPVLLHWQGFRVGEVPVKHRPRRHGRTKYGPGRLAKGFFDLLTVMLNTRFRARPLHLFGWVGSAIGGVGALALLYLVVLWFLDMGPIGNRPLLLFGALMVMVGIQLVSTGLLAELITKGQQAEKPAYVIRSVVPPGSRVEQPQEVPHAESADAADHPAVPGPGLRPRAGVPAAEDR